MIKIKLFGKLSITDADGKPVQIAGAKSQGLVAYLALNTEFPPTRDRLMALFWGDRFTDQARQSLRQAIAKLKRSLSVEDALVADQDRVGLNNDIVQIDVDEFAALVQDDSPEATERAVALMTGPILDGIYGQQPEFEDWIASERQRYMTMAMTLLERAANQALKARNVSQAEAFARQMIALDPLREASQIVLIRMLAQRGERAAAVQQFNSFAALLQKELDVGPGGDLQKLMAEVKGETTFFATESEPAQAEQTTSTETSHIKGRTSVAVVPFGALAPDPEQTMFIEGLTEDVTANLSRFSWIDVKASMENSGPRLTSAQMTVLGNELGLDYVVHGSLRAQGGRLRLTVQLAEPRTGRYVWVTRYDRETDDLFALQDELADTIAASVDAELARRVSRSSREIAFEEMGAWECYHRGLAIQYEFNADTNLAAQKHFRRAIELDPNFGLAYARLSYAIVISVIYFEAEDVQGLLDDALRLAKEAARLEPDDAVARFALGRVYLARGEYDRSIADLKAAIELNPGLAQAHCGLGDSMAYSGQLTDAMSCFEEAVRISPSDPYRWAFLGYGATALLFQGDYEGAIKWAAEAEATPNSHYWATAIRASALAHLDRMDDARRALGELRDLRPGITADFVRSRLFYLRDPAQIDIYVGGLEKAGLE